MILSEPYSASYYVFRENIDPVVYTNLLDRRPGIKMASIMSALGLVRYFSAVPYTGLPAEIRPLVVENYCRDDALAAMLNEYENAPLRKKNVPALAPLPKVPITVIHHSVEKYRRELMTFYLSYNELERIESLWMDMLHTITEQSPYSRIIFAKKSTGNININEPEIIIETVVSAIKK
jgi:hypothetical protein